MCCCTCLLLSYKKRELSNCDSDRICSTKLKVFPSSQEKFPNYYIRPEMSICMVETGVILVWQAVHLHSWALGLKQKLVELYGTKKNGLPLSWDQLPFGIVQKTPVFLSSYEFYSKVDERGTVLWFRVQISVTGVTAFFLGNWCPPIQQQPSGVVVVVSAPPVSDLTAPEDRQALAIRGVLTLWLF